MIKKEKQKVYTELIQQKTEDFFKEMSNLITEKGYTISINIEPPKSLIEPTGYVSLETVKNWKIPMIEEGFYKISNPTGISYHYRGKLALTVK